MKIHRDILRPQLWTFDVLRTCTTPSDPPECIDVLKEWSAFENTADATRPVLFATSPSMWTSHLRLAHQESDTFSVSAVHLFPDGYGKDKSPFQMEANEMAVTTEFWVKSEGSADASVVGVAINGLVGETTERQRIGSTLEETAEIWLVKV